MFVYLRPNTSVPTQGLCYRIDSSERFAVVFTTLARPDKPVKLCSKVDTWGSHSVYLEELATTIDHGIDVVLRQRGLGCCSKIEFVGDLAKSTWCLSSLVGQND